MLLALGFGIPAGVLAALSRRGLADRFVMAFAIAGIAIPVFVVAPLLTLVFALWLRWLPVAGWLPGRPSDIVLPIVALALPVIAFVARLTRGSLARGPARTVDSRGTCARIGGTRRDPAPCIAGSAAARRQLRRAGGGRRPRRFPRSSRRTSGCPAWDGISCRAH
jgi:hypothetical protein